MSHALLGPSGAHRWLNCTPSARLEEDYPDTSSPYAQEGTDAHDLAARLLENLKDPSFVVETIESEYYSEEMQEACEAYRDFVANAAAGFNQQPHMAIEQRFDLTDFIPESFGTADCVLVGGDHLQVIDLKYGKGVIVDAKDNPQIRLYALGALQHYKQVFQIDLVTMTIYQPRTSGIYSQEILSREELEAWGESIKPNAILAFNGEGELNPSEDNCRWCKHRGNCAARAENFMASFEEVAKDANTPVTTLTPARKAEILSLLKGIEKWIKEIEESALSDALAGKQLPGYKVVEGRSNRRLTSEPLAVDILTKEGFDEAMLYERKLLGLTALEKLVGKKKLSELLAEVIDKPKGKPALVPDTDPRPVFENDLVDANALFNGLQTE